jgi:glutathione synthase/RimK-type ligase-like ATP-grasp enzyme
MKLAIESSNESYSESWCSFCDANQLEYILVDFKSPDFIDLVSACTHLLSAPNLSNCHDLQGVKNLLKVVESMGLTVYPNNTSFWHYDDKIAQMYLLTSIGAPVVDSHCFWTLVGAMEYIATCEYPFVFKLKAGAGSTNVQLVRTQHGARKLAYKMFGRGMLATHGYLSDFKRKVRGARTSSRLKSKIKRIPKSFKSRLHKRLYTPRERGYFYVQKFLPDNQCDLRVTVVGDKAFGYRRMTRPNDFRASGSGNISWDQSEIDPVCVKIAHEISQKIGSQTMAYDFIYDNGTPKLVEISYNFIAKYVSECPGYWNKEGVYTESRYKLEDLLISQLIGE